MLLGPNRDIPKELCALRGSGKRKKPIELIFDRAGKANLVV
jgi:hypothetical protein